MHPFKLQLAMGYHYVKKKEKKRKKTFICILFLTLHHVHVRSMVFSEERGSRHGRTKEYNAVLTLESFVFLCPHFFSCAKSMESIKLEGQRKVLTLKAINWCMKQCGQVVGVKELYRFKEYCTDCPLCGATIMSTDLIYTKHWKQIIHVESIV